MRDVLYISDIDNSFHFVNFSDDCILLYNQPTAEKGEVVECYKIYYKISPDTYVKSYETMQEDTTFNYYNVSNSFWARKDIGQFSVLLLTVFFIGIFLINIVTSCVKKGGIFGGLL